MEVSSMVRSEPSSKREFQKHFDKVGPSYEKMTFEGSIGAKFVDIKEQELVKSMHREYFYNKKKILDIGAGNGRWSKLFLSMGCEVYSLDNSVEMCKKLRSIKGITVIDGNVEEKDIAEKFDIIFSMRTLKYTDLRKVMANLDKNLNASGVMILELPNTYNPFYILSRFLSPILPHMVKRKTIGDYLHAINYYTERRARVIFSNFGYEVIGVKKLFFFPDYFYSKADNVHALSIMRGIDSIFYRIFPTRFIFVIKRADCQRKC
jgi:2-polyprenyl-3-methyl-5-hydroxy-6-metoxy-1,4-benzoquinol methylase